MVLEYYQVAFLQLHAELETNGGVPDVLSRKRKGFWQFVLPGEYGSSEAQEHLIRNYLRSSASHHSGLFARNTAILP